MKIKKLWLLICFFIFIALQAGATFLFPGEIYKIYLRLGSFFYYYLFILIIFSTLLIFILGAVNFKYIKKLIKEDRYFLAISIILAVGFLIMISWQPILLRVDKELMVISAARDFNLRYFSDLGEGPAGRAKALFFLLHYLSFIVPLTVKTLAVINSFLMIFQGFLVYLILKLLLSRGEIAFGASLLFIFFPNSFLLGVSPEYVVPAQSFALFSIFALLLFLKFRDKKIFIWSLSILALSLLLRLDIIIFLPIYFFILYRSLDQGLILRLKNIIILFLAVILPITFQIFLGYATGSLTMAVNPIGPEFFAGDNQMIKAMISHHYYPYTDNPTGSVLSDYPRILRDSLKFDIFYLFKTIPMSFFLLFSLFFIKKNQNIQIFYFYFIVCLLAVSLFAYKERINVPQYLAYVIPPLVIITGLTADWFLKHGVGRTAFGFLVPILIIFNLVNFQSPYWGQRDLTTYLWNNEYNYILKYKDLIGDNSVIISNHPKSLIDGVIDNQKNIRVVSAEKNLNEQIHLLRNNYRNVYLTQGLLSHRDKWITFGPDDWQKVIDEKFRYQIIYKYNLGAEIGRNFPIFLYKILP